MSRREKILLTVQDLVSSFAWYDRKEDEDLPRGEIEAALKAGEVSVDEIGAVFVNGLREWDWSS